jgi:hypothetical protein
MHSLGIHGSDLGPFYMIWKWVIKLFVFWGISMLQCKSGNPHLFAS